jgi:hypothetical protein
VRAPEDESRTAAETVLLSNHRNWFVGEISANGEDERSLSCCAASTDCKMMLRLREPFDQCAGHCF